MSLMTSTNVTPSNEVVVIDKTYMTKEEHDKFVAENPSYANAKYPSSGSCNDSNTDVAFYKNPPYFRFQFNCSGGTGCLRWYIIRYTNVRSGETFSSYSPRLNTYGNEYYNGDIVNVRMGTFVRKTNNSQEWQYQRILFQSDPNHLNKNDTNEPLYDMKFCRGYVRVVGNQLRISDNISNLLNARYFYDDGTDYVQDSTDSGGTYHKGNKIMIDGVMLDKYGYSRANCYVVGGACIEINGEKKLIRRYNSDTGEITLDSNFSSSAKPKDNDNFVIWTNYLIDKPHFVMNRSKPYIVDDKNKKTDVPEITTFSYTPRKSSIQSYQFSNNKLTVTSKVDKSMRTATTDELYAYHEKVISALRITCNTIHCNAIYKQDEHSGLKCYQYFLYRNLGSTNNEILKLVDKSEEIYSFKLTHDFYLPIEIGKQYKIVLKVTTQDNATYTYSNYYTDNRQALTMVDENSFKADYITTSGCGQVRFKWNTKAMGRIALFRRERVNRRDKTDTNWGNWCLIKEQNVDVKAGDMTFINDYTIGYNTKYQYAIMYSAMHEYFSLTETSNVYDEFVSEVEVEHYAPIVSSVVEYNNSLSTLISVKQDTDKYNRHCYKVANIWNFVAQPETNDIAQNVGSNFFETTNAMPLVTRTDKEYESSNFALDIYQFECSADKNLYDDMIVVKDWVKFINGQNDFIYRNPKGDVWLIDVINSSATRSYAYGTDSMYTFVKYDWAEVDDINNIIVE